MMSERWRIKGARSAPFRGSHPLNSDVLSAALNTKYEPSSRKITRPRNISAHLRYPSWSYFPLQLLETNPEYCYTIGVSQSSFGRFPLRSSLNSRHNRPFASCPTAGYALKSSAHFVNHRADPRFSFAPPIKISTII